MNPTPQELDEQLTIILDKLYLHHITEADAADAIYAWHNRSLEQQIAAAVSKASREARIDELRVTRDWVHDPTVKVTFDTYFEIRRHQLTVPSPDAAQPEPKERA